MPTIFNSTRVLHDLTTPDKVNGREIKLAVSLLNEKIVIDSPLSFENVSVNNLNTNDLISGINFDKWTKTAFQHFSPKPQIVTAHWHIKKAIIDSLSTSQSVIQNIDDDEPKSN